MMKRIFFLALLSCIVHAAVAQQQQEFIVRSFFEQLGKSNFTSAMQYMAPIMKEKLTADVLKGIWQQVEAANGRWEAVVSQKITREGTHYVVTADNNFERTTLTFRIALDDSNKMIGFFITGSKPKQAVLNANELPDTVHAADGTVLYGTLTQPEGRPHGPVVLIIAGSGPTDRDGNSLFVPGRDSYSYQQLAQGLAANGIASLRYDKRGAGQSTLSGKSVASLTIDDYVADAVACVGHLQRGGKFSAVSVIGHSEGGIIGLKLAALTRLKCLIPLSTPGQCTDKVLLEQLKPRLSDTLYRQSVRILDELRQDITPAGVPADLNMLFNAGNYAYWKSSFRFDPCTLLAAVNIPVLIVGGAADQQVSPAQVALLQHCKPDTRLVLIPGMTHALKNSSAISPDNKTPLSLSPELIPALASFIRQ
jgi:pimeloyl-ACP methyl ester carboxylesterase